MTLPLIISVPHAGLWVPPEVGSRSVLTPQQIAEDGDGGADEIYDFTSEVRSYVKAVVARAIVDLNRADDDMRKDGVIKTHTCWDVPVYREQPSLELIEILLERYYRPYHQRLSRPFGAILGVDCHTMAATAPPVSPDPGQRRPAVCLGNAHGATCPEEWLEALRRCFSEHFDEVSLNEPFRGGYIVRSHGSEMPWVQLELSRDPSLSNSEKRSRVLASLRRFCDVEWPRLEGRKKSA